MAVSRHLVIAFVWACCLCLTAVSSTSHMTCPEGWTLYVPTMSCLKLNSNKTPWLSDAQELCENRESNSTLMVIQTNDKFKFVKDMLRKHSNETRMWTGLTKGYYYGLRWYGRNGKKIEDEIAPILSRYADRSERCGYSGAFYIHNGMVRGPECASRKRILSVSICEQDAICQEGFFGAGCAKECHCYGQTCEPTVKEVDNPCPHGCQRGWMGEACSQRKQIADVNYYCVNSADQGTFAHIRINTHGVPYESFDGVESNGELMPRCRDDVVNSWSIKNEYTIRIRVDFITKVHIRGDRKLCSGKELDNGLYEWTFRLQEKEGLVSLNDQEFRLQCNFSDASSLSVSQKTSIKKEKFFRASDIVKPVVALKERKRPVNMTIVDPFTGQPSSRSRLGRPVVIKISFDQGTDDLLSGVFPFNCDAVSADGKKTVQLSDESGCPVANSPISAFFRNGTNSVITKPFPLFGIDSERAVQVQCSYKLCFEDDQCPAICKSSIPQGLSYHSRRVIYTREDTEK